MTEPTLKIKEDIPMSEYMLHKKCFFNQRMDLGMSYIFLKLGTSPQRHLTKFPLGEGVALLT